MQSLHEKAWENDPEAINAIKKSQDLLKKHDIGIHDEVNKVRALNKGRTPEYAKKVWKNLDDAVKNAEKKGLTEKEAVLGALAGMKGKIAQAGDLGAI